MMTDDELDLLFADLDVSLVDLTDHINEQKDTTRNEATAAAEMIADARSLIEATRKILRPDVSGD